jgi:hypothetical protein
MGNDHQPRLAVVSRALEEKFYIVDYPVGMKCIPHHNKNNLYRVYFRWQTQFNVDIAITRKSAQTSERSFFGRDLQPTFCSRQHASKRGHSGEL